MYLAADKETIEDARQKYREKVAKDDDAFLRTIIANIQKNQFVDGVSALGSQYDPTEDDTYIGLLEGMRRAAVEAGHRKNADRLCRAITDIEVGQLSVYFDEGAKELSERLRSGYRI
ncbi:MAG: hypothetical protein ACE5FW_01185 [Candidatus Aenigmatarchaeota archaeon]